MQSQFAASQAKSKYLHVTCSEKTQECLKPWALRSNFCVLCFDILKVFSVFVMRKINWRNMAGLRNVDEGQNTMCLIMCKSRHKICMKNSIYRYKLFSFLIKMTLLPHMTVECGNTWQTNLSCSEKKLFLGWMISCYNLDRMDKINERFVLLNKLVSEFSINHYKKLMSSSMLILKFHYVLLHLEHGQDYSL